MKTARTIRTLRRAGQDPASVGFAGFTPTGKAVRRMAKEFCAEKRLLSALPAPMVSVFWQRGMTQRASIKGASRFVRSPAVVQDAWLRSAA